MKPSIQYGKVSLLVALQHAAQPSFITTGVHGLKSNSRHVMQCDFLDVKTVK